MLLVFDFLLWYTHQGCELGIPLLNNHVALDKCLPSSHTRLGSGKLPSEVPFGSDSLQFLYKFFAGTFLHLKGIYSALGEADRGCLNGF